MSSMLQQGSLPFVLGLTYWSGAHSPECSCTAQLVVGTPFWEKQAAEAWVSHRDHPEDRVLYGALYAVLMA